MEKPNKRKQASTAVKKIGAMSLAIYVPGFLRIHARYARNHFRAWAALFVAPFLAIKLALVSASKLFELEGTWRYDFIAILLVGFFFYLAERRRDVRQYYVYAAPTIMGIGLLYWAGGGGFLNIGFAVKAALIILFTLKVGQFTISRGYEQLSEGANKHFHKGKIHYQAGEYDLAMPFFEKAARRGHFKSLYLLGVAHENGQFYERDLIKAAYYYLKAGKKGYAEANERYKKLIESMSNDEKDAVQKSLY